MARCMPAPSGEVCTFTVDEVGQILNMAGQYGFPDERSLRRVVPLFKNGLRSDPASYRTIMVGNTFAKLYGSLIENRLSSWCEEQKLRAPAQAGFRRGHSTLDHLRRLIARYRLSSHSLRLEVGRWDNTPRSLRYRDP
ncbi:hypothetical protein R1sor_014051 [Riccia sorocarpa]|uniref:Reverse transcriptase domain-containing protein n=1 Tax=Riccia sorocarpa TaxID=122646 RepID=A0ABD3HAW7_9MARC